MSDRDEPVNPTRSLMDKGRVTFRLQPMQDGRPLELVDLGYGSVEYLQWLEGMANLHYLKSQAYDGDKKPFSNFRVAEEVGIPAWKAAMVRWLDKITRIKNLVKDPTIDPNDESIEDTLDDLAAYSGIVKILRREAQRELAEHTAAVESQQYPAKLGQTRALYQRPGAGGDQPVGPEPEGDTLQQLSVLSGPGSRQGD